MRQAIYNTTVKTNSISTHSTTFQASRKATLRRHLALKWDLYGVLALLASTMAYGVFVLGQVA